MHCTVYSFNLSILHYPFASSVYPPSPPSKPPVFVNKTDSSALLGLALFVPVVLFVSVCARHAHVYAYTRTNTHTLLHSLTQVHTSTHQHSQVHLQTRTHLLSLSTLPNAHTHTRIHTLNTPLTLTHTLTQIHTRPLVSHTESLARKDLDVVTYGPKQLETGRSRGCTLN